MARKAFLITGITGFAGAHLANLLHDEGHAVFGLVRGSNGMETDILDVVSQRCMDSIIFIHGDLTDHARMVEIFGLYAFDGVFHLAAQSHPPTSLQQPLDTMRTNVMGTAHLIDAIERGLSKDCRLMFCSTSEVYGNTGQDGRKLKEGDPLLPSNPYAASKAASDLYLQERMANKKINGFITRAFSHTGPRRGRNFSISSDAYQLAKIMARQQKPVLQVGNLETVRVVLDVRDVVKAYYLLMMNPTSEGKVFNVCGDVPLRMNAYTDMLIDASGLTGDVEKSISTQYFRPIDIYYQHGDTTALRELTGWEPTISIEKTMQDLLFYWVQKINNGSI